jgi:hypothetical protein
MKSVLPELRPVHPFAGVLYHATSPNRVAQAPWGSLGSDFFYKGYTPQLALVMPDFIGFLRSELWGSKNAFNSEHS